MNFDYLNKMIDYIENNLDNEIDFNELSKITNTNIFILEHVFMFLTSMTITEYIKKRRLSKAFEDIRNTNLKIIDIAFKYQYNSKEYFETNKTNYNFDYEIKEINSITLYCYHIASKNHSDLLYKIRELYKKVKNNNYYKEFNEVGMYGIFSKNENIYNYYLGSTKYFSNLEKYKIEKNKYAIFKLISRNQNDIVSLEEKINKQWMPATNYNINNNLKIELYMNDSCYIYLPIK